MQEAVYSLRHYRQRLDLDPARLREVEQRLEAVHAAARKYRVTPERLPETAGAGVRAPRAAGRRARAWRSWSSKEHAAAQAYLAGGADAQRKERARGARSFAGRVSERCTRWRWRADASRLRSTPSAGGRRARSGAGRIPGGRALRRAAAAAGQGRLRRRAVAPQPGDSDRHQRGGGGADADLRRSGCRHRRARGRDRRAHAAASSGAAIR